MKLDRRQLSFKIDEVTYLDRKTLFLDRMMLRLFAQLRFDGKRVVHKQAASFDVPRLVGFMTGPADRFPGFADRPDAAEAWLRSDLLDIMNRGKRDRETLVGPRPFHLNAFKATNRSAVADWGASDQVWAMLYHADRPLLRKMRDFFGVGLDFEKDRYDGVTDLDVQTLAVLGIVDQITVMHDTGEPAVPLEPVCRAQGALLADDLQRLLAYSRVVPRLVLADYCKTIIGLHLALYQLRLFGMIPEVVRQAQSANEQIRCQPEIEQVGLAGCPYALPISIDLTGDVTSAAGAIGRRSAETHLSRVPSYVRAIILLNRLKEFAVSDALTRRAAPPQSLTDLLSVLSSPPADIEGYFKARISDALAKDDDDEQDDPVALAVAALPQPALDRYVELICLRRMRQERSQLVRLIDSLAQKNRPGGFLRQNPGTRSPRWFSLDSSLLEVLVQIAVVQRDANVLSSRPILLRDFVDWLYERYGLEIYAPSHRQVPPEEQPGWQLNQQALRERLHQIGFYVDLSDAFNSQTVRPRYELM